MEEKLSCSDLIQTLSSDVRTFLNGGENSDVTLSDGVTIPSYRKYVISDLTRTGNNVQARTYFVDDIITYNFSPYVCIKNCTISDINSPLNPLEWKQVGNFSVLEGTGFDAFLSYDLRHQRIVASANIESVVVNFQDSNLLQVKINKEVIGDKKLGVIFTGDVSNIPNEGLFVDNVQNTVQGAGNTYIGSNSDKKRYPENPVFRLASTMPAAKVILNVDNNYHIKVVQGFQFFSGRANAYNFDYTNPISYDYDVTYNFRNANDIDTFKSIVNLLFFVMP